MLSEAGEPVPQTSLLGVFIDLGVGFGAAHTNIP